MVDNGRWTVTSVPVSGAPVSGVTVSSVVDHGGPDSLVNWKFLDGIRLYGIGLGKMDLI